MSAYPTCGHDACRRSFVDTGSSECAAPANTAGAGHTPGPWVAERSEHPRGWYIEARGGTYTVAVARDGTGLPQNAANARLITAAPDLLAALTTLDSLWSESAAHGVDFDHAIAQARAAIAKVSRP